MGRKMMNGRSPSFFKVLIGDFATKLRVPSAFLKNFNGNLPKISILKSITENSWRVIMEKNDEGFFFSRGWSEFVRDHRLEEGDFLLFWFIGNSTFEVMIYGRTACEKDIGFACKGRSIRSNQLKKSQVSHNVSCASLKRARSSHKIKIESEQKEVAEVDFNIKQNDPYFVKVLHGNQRFSIFVPKGFAKETGLIHKKSTVVKDPQGNVWSVDVRTIRSGQVYLSTGWSDFWVAKGLADGDTCLFQYMQGTGNVLHVQIFSKGAGISGSGPATKVPNRG